MKNRVFPEREVSRDFLDGTVELCKTTDILWNPVISGEFGAARLEISADSKEIRRGPT